MSLNPLNELKRRLQDDSTPLPKRLCLAKNVIYSHHFPSAPKESIVGLWLDNLSENNKLDEKLFKDVLGWIGIDDLTAELKTRLIQVVSKYIEKNSVQDNILQPLLIFIENDKISLQLTQNVDEYLSIVVILLNRLRNEETLNITAIQRLLNNLNKHYKLCKKKLEFIVKLLDGVNLETIFTFLDTECQEKVIKVCENILFPNNKKTFFISFLQTLIRKDNIDELIAENKDNIQSVLKIMSAFFTYPKGRSEKNPKFLSDFVKVFVSCFRSESQIIFAFYIMVASSLNMNQNYLHPAMKIPPIIFEENDDKIKRNLFLKMLEILLKNEVDISVRLTDTFGEKISKVEIKKTFMSFLQAVMMGQLKLEGKLDKTTLQIVKVALTLDPVLIEQKMDQILPSLMTTKKTSTTNKSYKEMFNCLLEILFKLSRGTIFINQILPNIKLSLEASNTEQFKLKQKIKEAIDNDVEYEKLKSKLIKGDDIFPTECVEMYGKLTAELMFRQNKELLISLQKDFEENCLMMLEEGFVSPSIITLAEVLSAILSSFLQHSKMADHTVQKQIAEDFWQAFEKFEKECLGKFGECILKLNYDPQLSLSFLKLSLSVSQLKLLNMKYSHTKLNLTPNTSEVSDLSTLLPCLSSEQWKTLMAKVTDDEAVLVLYNLILAKTMALQLSKSNDDLSKDLLSTKSHLIKQLANNSEVLNINGFTNVLFSSLEKGQSRQLAKNLVKLCINNPEIGIFNSTAVMNDKTLINSLLLEVVKNITKCFQNLDVLTKALSKNDFNFTEFAKEHDIKSYFEQVTLKGDQETEIPSYINLISQIPLPYLEENYQLVAIFVLLATKKCCQKKIRKSVDHILLKIHELSPKHPDLYKIFPVEYIFSFEDESLINLLTLKIKISNNLFILKCVLECAVKKVKTDSEIVKNLVEILLSKQKIKKNDVSSIEYFSNTAFQMTCLILPIIAKEKRAITTSNYRSILANLQERLHKSMLDCFKNIDFSNNSSLFNETTGNIDESMVVSENTLATLNAMAAYSLTLSKYCETTDANEIKNLDCLWSGLEYFVQNAINCIQNPQTKNLHVESSIQLLNVVLRHIKKLDSHTIFVEKDKLFIQIWKSILSRLLIVFEGEKRVMFLDDLSVTLKFICESITVECFSNNFVGELTNLIVLKKPSELMKEENKTTKTSHKVFKYVWNQCLKANIIGPKCVSLSKLLSKITKQLRTWLLNSYDEVDSKKRKHDDDDEIKVIKIYDVVCDLMRINLSVVSEGVLAAKKITLDYKLLDGVFQIQHMAHYIIASTRFDVSWESFFKLYEGCISVLNSLLVSREELLEDRWPNFMQCYRALLSCLCQRSSAQAQLERSQEEKLAEIAHGIEKLTQSICKRKNHVSRIAAYTVADICSLLESKAPTKMVRQHLENSAALLLQAADSSYAAAFLRRALASSPGHVTLANMYTLYKRYHKYTGNA